MSTILRTIASAAVLVAATSLFAGSAAAGPGDLAPGGGFKIYKAQLAIKNQDGAPPGCPAHKTIMGWVYMSHKATVEVMVFRKGKSIPTPVPITSVKAPNGQYVATYTAQALYDVTGTWEYRMLVGGGQGVASNWVKLTVNC